MRISDWSSDVCSSDLEQRRQLGQTFDRALGARMLVAIDDRLRSFAPLYDHRRDLAVEKARGRALVVFLLRCHGEAIRLLPSDPVFVGNVVAGLRHRVPAAPRLDAGLGTPPPPRPITPPP